MRRKWVEEAVTEFEPGLYCRTRTRSQAEGTQEAAPPQRRRPR